MYNQENGVLSGMSEADGNTEGRIRRVSFSSDSLYASVASIHTGSERCLIGERKSIETQAQKSIETQAQAHQNVLILVLVLAFMSLVKTRP